MTGSPYSDCDEAIKNVWNANWVVSPTIAVLWGDQWVANDIDATKRSWLNLQIIYTDEMIRAFGGGRFDNDRVIVGSVIVTVYVRVGTADEFLYSVFDDAMNVFRSRRVGNLSFSAVATMLDNPPRFGVWRGQSAMIPFEWRFRG